MNFSAYEIFELLVLIITAIITGIGGIYIPIKLLGSSSRIEVKKEQFNKIYLPSFFYLRDLLENDLTHILSISEANYIYELFFNSPQLVDPSLLKVIEGVQSKTISEEMTHDETLELYNRIRRKYEKLGIFLGYPCYDRVVRILVYALLIILMLSLFGITISLIVVIKSILASA